MLTGIAKLDCKVTKSFNYFFFNIFIFIIINEKKKNKFSTTSCKCNKRRVPCVY